MNTSAEHRFFRVFFNSVRSEDRSLRKLFHLNAPRYHSVHNGVWQLYETTYVYILSRALLADEFPYEVNWECPYPSNNQLHADIGLKMEVKTELLKKEAVTDLIEFKLWLSDDVSAIWNEVKKLQQESCDRYIVVVNYGGPRINTATNQQYLMTHVPGIQPIDADAFLTMAYNWKNTKQEERSTELMMFRVI